MYQNEVAPDIHEVKRWLTVCVTQGLLRDQRAQAKLGHQTPDGTPGMWEARLAT